MSAGRAAPSPGTERAAEEESPGSVGGGLARLGTDTGWGIVGDVVTLLVTLVSFKLVSSGLGTVGYGYLGAIYGLTGLLGGLTVTPLGGAAMQHLVADREDRMSVARSITTLTLVLGAAATALGLVLCHLMLDGVGLGVFAVYCLQVVIVAGLFALINTFVHATVGYAEAARLRVLQATIRLVTVVTLWATTDITLWSIAVFEVIGAALALTATMMLTRRRYGLQLGLGRVDVAHLRSTGLYSTTSVAFSIQNDFDKTIMVSNGHVADNGRYTAAYRIVAMVQIPLNQLVFATHHRFLHWGHDEEHDTIRITLMLSVVAIGIGLLGGGAVFIAYPLVQAFLGDEFSGTRTIFAALIPMVCLRGAGFFPYNALMTYRRFGLRVVAIGTSATISLVLYLVLIPSMSWHGAVIGTLVGEAALVVMSWVLLLQVHHRHRGATARSATEAGA